MKHGNKKEHSNFPVTNPREMEIYLSDKEFKIIVLEILSSGEGR